MLAGCEGIRLCCATLVCESPIVRVCLLVLIGRTSDFVYGMFAEFRVVTCAQQYRMGVGEEKILVVGLGRQAGVG